MKTIFGEPLQLRRERIWKAYQKKFEQLPFILLDMQGQDTIDAFELMDTALISGEPIADADIKRLCPEYPPHTNII